MLVGEIGILHNRNEKFTFNIPLGLMKVGNLGISSCAGAMDEKFDVSLDVCGACSFFLQALGALEEPVCLFLVGSDT